MLLTTQETDGVTSRVLPHVILSALLIAGCGGNNDDKQADSYDDDYLIEDSFDISQLPGDFPQELILPDYERADYADMTQFGGAEGAAFESSAPADATIDHYITLLGEPKINVTTPDGGRNAIWQETPWSPWMVSVLGDRGESLVSVAKAPTE